MPPTPILKRRAGVALLLCSLFVLDACRSIPGYRYVRNLGRSEFGGGRISQQELRESLCQYASRFEATIVAAADTISANTRDPIIQRRTLRWKLGVTPVVNQAAFLREPEAAYVAMLTVATAMHDFLTIGGGTDAFGTQQQIAVDASADLLQAAIALGDTFLDDRELARVTADVAKLVRTQPIRGEFVAEQVQTLITTTEASPMFDWVTAIPLSPFRALQGVDEGAQAIREFNNTAMEMTRIIASMPRLVRWNMELLALDITQQGDIEATLQGFQDIARSTQTISEMAAALPETLRELLNETNRAGQSLVPLSQSLERSATAVAQAGTAWNDLVTQLSQPPANPSQPSRPFDIREWQAAAAQITSAATELRALLESAGTLAGSEQLAGPLAEVTARVEKIEAGSRALVDFAAWRALQLIVVFFALLFVYRRIETWLARRAASR